MLGNILLGSYTLGDQKLGVYTAEVQANISRSTSVLILRGHAVFSSYHTKFRIPDLDIIIDLRFDADKFIPGIGIGSYGNFDEFGTILQSGIGFRSYSIFTAPLIVARGPNRLQFGAQAFYTLEHPDENSVAWSNIGALDFNIGKDNVAGKMPIDFNGYVYAIERLGNSEIVYVYGANGIVRLSASGVYWGSKRVANIGIKSKHALVNTGDAHYFVANNNSLYKISLDNVVTKLGYSEFLSDVDDIVMSYDSYNKLIYICNGVKGFVYSEDSDSFGVGPNNVTGIKWQDHTMFVVSSSEIVIPDFSIVTDIYDMGTPKEKTIFELLVEVDDPTELQAAIDYRLKIKDSFVSTPWKYVNPFGIVHLPCYGREFRFKFKGEIQKIESITINGVVHGFSFLDTITIK
jgi:hypothetical protein